MTASWSRFTLRRVLDGQWGIDTTADPHAKPSRQSRLGRLTTEKQKVKSSSCWWMQKELGRWWLAWGFYSGTSAGHARWWWFSCTLPETAVMSTGCRHSFSIVTVSVQSAGYKVVVVIAGAGAGAGTGAIVWYYKWYRIRMEGQASRGEEEKNDTWQYYPLCQIQYRIVYHSTIIVLGTWLEPTPRSSYLLLICWLLGQ